MTITEQRIHTGDFVQAPYKCTIFGCDTLDNCFNSVINAFFSDSVSIIFTATSIPLHSARLTTPKAPRPTICINKIHFRTIPTHDIKQYEISYTMNTMFVEQKECTVRPNCVCKRIRTKNHGEVTISYFSVG